MWIVGLCVVILAVYLSTLSPSIAGGDSGEIVAEGCILGTAHPPGYPLLTLIIYLTSLVPYETVAYRVNLLSAFFTTVACWSVGSTIQLLSVSISNSSSVGGSIFGMGMFAFSPLIWQYAVTAEVFPLNTMFASLLIYLTVLFTKYENEKISLFGSFICGLSLGNQHTIILFEFPLVLWMCYLQLKKFRDDPLRLYYHVLFFLLGFSIYLYLPLAEAFNPQAGSWGHVSSFSGFVHHFLRKDYGTFQLFSGNRGRKTDGFLERNLSYLLDVWSSQGYYHSLCFAICGITISCYLCLTSVAKLQTSRKEMKNKFSKDIATQKLRVQETRQSNWMILSAMILFLTLLFYFLVFHSLSNLPLDDPLLYGVHQRFWMQPNIILFIFAGIGFNFVASVAFSKAPSQFFVGLTILVALSAVYLQYQKWLFLSDQSDAYYFRNYATALVSHLPPRSILLINYDMQWTSVRYMQKCEGLRPDVVVINLSMMTYSWFQHKRHLYPNISFPGGFHSQENSPQVMSKQAFTLSQFVSSNVDQWPIFLSGKLTFRDALFEKTYEHIPLGLVSRILPKDQVPEGAIYAQEAIYSWESVRSSLTEFPPEDRYSELTWEWTIGRDTKDRLTDTAAYLLESALKVSTTDYKPLVTAIYFLESAIHFESERHSNSSKTPPTALLKNTGLAHVNLIQNKLVPPSSLPLPNDKDLFGSAAGINWPVESWKIWSTERFLATWGEFLRRPDAQTDPQYQIIRKMYETAVSKKK